MTDPYRPTTLHSTGAAEPAARGTTALRALLWVVLVCSATGNLVLSFVGAPLAPHLGVGVVSALSLAGLIVLLLRGRQ